MPIILMLVGAGIFSVGALQFAKGRKAVNANPPKPKEAAKPIHVADNPQTVGDPKE